MSELDSQQRAFYFLLDKYKTQEPFTRTIFREATGWSEVTFKTYWGKQFKTLLQPAGEESFRVHEAFRRFITWDKFKNHVTQNRKVAADYKTFCFNNVMIFDFFMPLTNEEYLRESLDALFYKDSILTRLKTIDIEKLKKFYKMFSDETSEEYYDRLCNFVSNRFVGYSISHVAGRFRASNLKTVKEAYLTIEKLDKYLVDETTAVVRFIFPCGKKTPEIGINSDNYFETLAMEEEDDCKAEDELKLTRLLFFILFVQNIVMIVNGEDEIWLLESGMRNKLHIWRTD